ncbi:GtrA family protein [Herbaspirillum frisingense]|uniref:GtrA family protein n=1 Tax=Herbaspirillum frisingense TaxID=92645 RepID=UPI0039AF4398
MFASTTLAIRYAIFALIATAANILSQDFVVRIYHGPLDIIASVAVGTGVGLVIKYVLDKRYIFGFRARSVGHDTQVFFLYTLMGLLTTVIFWGVELGFEYIFETREMRYLGGIIGLAIGYLMKYRLDRRYVFRPDAG